MKKLITILLLFICSYTQATTYYIRTDGSNSNSGLVNNAGGAWLTLFYACGHTTSGDIISVQAGSYTEVSTCNLLPGVSIEGVGITAIIKSTLSAQYVPIISLASAEGTNGSQHISGIKMDGQSLQTSWAIAVSGRSNVSIYNCRIVDFMETGVNWAGRADNNPLPPSIYATGNSFYNNYVSNCATADPSFGRGCFQFGGQDGMLVYNDSIINIGRATGTGGWPIKGCNDGYIKGCKVYNCYLERDPYPYNQNGTNGYWNFAFEMFYESGLEMYNNTVLGSIDVNHQTKGTYDYSFYVHDNNIGHATLGDGEESGIIMEFETQTAIIANNTIKNVAYGIYFTPRTTNHIDNITAQNNLIYGNGRNTGGMGAAGFGIAEQTPEDGTVMNTKWYVINNTFIGATGGNAPNFCVRIPDGGVTNDARINNNIIQGYASNCIRANPASVIDTLQIKNNDFYLNGNSNAISFVSGTPSHYTNSGNLVGTNPLFTNVGANIYTLQGGSPCINAGTDGTDIGYTGGADVLLITANTPTDGATGIVITVNPTITFNAALNAATVNNTNITFTQNGNAVAKTFIVASNLVTVVPGASLLPNTTYVLTIGTGVQDAEGNALDAPHTITFTTAVSNTTIITNYFILRSH